MRTEDVPQEIRDRVSAANPRHAVIGNTAAGTWHPIAELKAMVAQAFRPAENRGRHTVTPKKTPTPPTPAPAARRAATTPPATPEDALYQRVYGPAPDDAHPLTAEEQRVWDRVNGNTQDVPLSREEQRVWDRVSGATGQPAVPTLDRTEQAIYDRLYNGPKAKAGTDTEESIWRRLFG